MTPSSATKPELLRRGWYVVTGVETAFLRLSGRAHDLLIIIKHLQASGNGCMPSRDHLAEITGQSVRAVQTTLTELCTKGALRRRRTGRASLYSAVYVLATIAEVRTLMGGEVQIPTELMQPDVQESCTSEAQDPRPPLLYKEEPKNNYIGALAPTAPEEPQMKRQQHPVDELDPVAALGIWNAQDSPQTPADEPEGLFPAPASSSRSTGRQMPAQRRNTAGSLALEFAALVSGAPWAGPSPVNIAALAKNLSGWMRNDSITADQIRGMMERYVGPDWRRRADRAPWLDFLGRRHALLKVAERASTAAALETNRDAADEHWLGTMAAA